MRGRAGLYFIEFFTTKLETSIPICCSQEDLDEIEKFILEKIRERSYKVKEISASETTAKIWPWYGEWEVTFIQ